MEKRKKIIKIILTIISVITIICVSIIPTFAYTAFNTNEVGEVSEWGWGIIPLNFVGIDFSVGEQGGSGYNSRYIYDITPTSYIPDNFFENYNNVALGQYGLHETLAADASADRTIVYDAIMEIRPRTFTDYTTSPTFDYNSIEYRYTFNPLDINITGINPNAVANNFYIRMSDFFIDLSDGNNNQPYHYMVSTQTTNNNLLDAQLSVQYDIVVPYSEKIGNDITFGFKTVKTVNRTETMRANTGYSIISKNDFTTEEIISAIGEYGENYIGWDYIMISNISINMYTECSYYHNSTLGYDTPPKFTYTITTPEYPSYSFEELQNSYLLSVSGNITNFENISWVNWLTTQIQSVFNIELFWGLSIGTIFAFVITIGLLFFFLKMFAGG